MRRYWPPAHVAGCRGQDSDDAQGCRATRLLALYDNRLFTIPSPETHMYHAVFQCEPVGGQLTTSRETSELRWVDEDEAATLPKFRGHVDKVPMAFRLYHAPTAGAVFH